MCLLKCILLKTSEDYGLCHNTVVHPWIKNKSFQLVIQIINSGEGDIKEAKISAQQIKIAAPSVHGCYRAVTLR